MRKNFFLAVLIAAGLTACKSNNKAAFNYSQDIVAKERSLSSDITETETDVKRFFGSGEYDSVAAASARMEKKVQQKIDEISAMKVPDAKEADSFRDAALKYFKYIKGIYTAYRAVGEATTDEDRQKKVEEMQEEAGKKQDVIDDMQRAQKKYAEANGFKVEI